MFKIDAEKTYLLEWCRSADSPQDNNMLFKDAAWKQIIFVRDTLKYLFGSQEVKTFVISTHYSKSIKLPVYLLEYKGLTLIMRYNFYDWKVSVLLEEDLGIDFGNLFIDTEKPISRHYCEGFQEDCVWGPYWQNKKKFTRI